MDASERHEDFDDTPVRCVACGTYCDPDRAVASPRGPLCQPCGEAGEAE